MISEQPGPASVTVVIPTFGRPERLRRAVDSVADDVEVIELIVVDDASPGGPPRTEDFADPRVRVIDRDENGGVAAAQNSGLAAANGTYIAFLHSDDAWLRSRLTERIAMLEHLDVAALESATIRTWESGQRLAPPRMAGKTHIELRNREVRDLHISGWLFRRDALVDIGGFDEHLRCYEDLDLLIRLTADHDVATEDEPPVVEIETGGSDRLGSSAWMSDGRLRLVRKYAEQLDPLPPGWRDWCTQVAADLLVDPKAGRREASALIRKARSGSLRRTLTTLPLAVAARAPTAMRVSIAGAQRRRQ